MTLPDNLFKHNSNLKKVQFYQNKLTTLPSALFANNPNLEDVRFDYNQLETLPADLFKHTRHLLKAQFANNKIATLPHKFFQFNQKLYQASFLNNPICQLDAEKLGVTYQLANPGDMRRFMIFTLGGESTGNCTCRQCTDSDKPMIYVSMQNCRCY